MKENINNNKKEFILSLIIPLSLGFLSYLLTKNGISNYNLYLNKPSFSPPSYLFFIVWTILYLLMGLSSYIIYNSMSCYKDTCLILYILNLLLNFFWPIIFFNLEARLFAFIFLIFLDIVVFFMTYCFYGINKKSSYLLIPYIIWILYATVLNFSIYFLNR